MLKELTKDDWLGFLGLGEERIPPVLVLRGTRNLRTNYAKYRAHFADILEVGSPNALFEDVFIGRRGGVDVGYASVYGAPMASEITHVFAVLGTRLVILTGVCGALGDDIEAGDAEIMANPSITVPRHAGPIWTTAALLAEGKAEIEQWHGEGYLAADTARRQDGKTARRQDGETARRRDGKEENSRSPIATARTG